MRTLAMLLLMLSACAGRQRAMPYDPNVVLMTLGPESARPFVLEQRLSGRYGERELDAHVVLQWQDGVLRLVGLAPFGARAFVVEQRGAEVHVESSLGRDLPFDPRHVLVDIHRVLFRSAGPPLDSGVREREDQGEWVQDRYAQGRLVERRFTPAAARAGKAVVVRFQVAAEPVLPRRVEIENQQRGYTLRIETLSQQWL